jgi:hypothetical protein
MEKVKKNVGKFKIKDHPEARKYDISCKSIREDMVMLVMVIQQKNRETRNKNSSGE